MPDAHLADPALTLYHTLEDIQWQRSFDARSLTRGRDYARQGRVRDGTRLERDGDLLVLRAQVDGSGRSRYLTSLAVDPGSPEMGVVSDCSCPVGRQCKHAVAVIQGFIDEMEADGLPTRDDSALLEQRWESWLAELESPVGGKRYVEELEEDYRLALFLDIDPNPRSPTLKVSPVWVRPTKQRSRGNGWVKPRPIMVRRGGGLSPRPPQGLSPDQEEALELLMLGEQRRQLAGGYEQYWSPVAHAFQARALWSLLESDTPPLLFHPKQTGAMLDPGPACRLTLAWEPDADGNQHLRADAEPAEVISGDAAIVRAGGELCYLDETRGRFGRLEGDPELLMRLRRAPPLPPEMSGWLTERLHQAPGLAERLPAPQAVEERTLESVTPRLKVTLQVATGQLGYRDGAMVPRWIEVGAAVVGFDYDGIEVPPEEGESAQAFRDGQRLTVMRDPEAELALVRSLPPGMVTLERLQQTDAVPAHLELPEWALLLPLDGTPPATAAEWPTHLAGPDDWWEMIARLRQAGCLVHFSDDFPEEPTYLEPDDWYGELEPAGNGWFDLALDIEVEGERLNLLPILRRLFKDPRFPLEPAEDEAEDATWTLTLAENRRLVMPLARLRSLMAPILDWLNDESDPEAALRLPVTAAEKVAPLAEHERWAGREDVSALARRLRELPASLPAPPGFAGELRDYQARGTAWMRFLSELGTGGILADDMGLGKTVQVLAHLLDERARGALARPTLVVAPTSLVGNWCAEAERFA
ncbi:SNF2-related protein, partial [Halomonas sp.]|uniref:SNF2-related protein n=1 Tax=Halomonas sp. TaxID=1486246 RepID=UPI00298DFCD2